MIRELDTRVIFGNGGRVIWGFDEDATHTVVVHDWQDKPVSVLKGLTPAEAALAYWHTFADPRVPDIFRRVPEDAPDVVAASGGGTTTLPPRNRQEWLERQQEGEQRLLDAINDAEDEEEEL